MRAIIFSVMLLAPAASPAAHADCGESMQNPFAAVPRALQLRMRLSSSGLAACIAQRLAAPELRGAGDLLLTAELLRQAGDYRADELYREAIAADDADPAYELFYADYLRNYRGPLRPLFAEAAAHYFAALEKLRRRPGNAAVGAHVERGLVALYQEDGIPLAWRQAAPDLLAPVLSFSPALRTARSTSDLDEVHDARDFTAEALFAASATRLNRPLTLDELRGLLRIKRPEETANRLRFRLEDSTFDLVYARRLIGNAEVTDFFVPDHFNRVELNTVGLTASQVIALPGLFDAGVKAGYEYQDRRGLVEFLPDALERVGQAQGELTLSRYLGPDKGDLTLGYVSQQIDQQIPQPPARDRRIAYARLDYDLLRPLPAVGNPYGDRFVTRGWQFYGGVVDDEEHFGTVEVRRKDFLVGTSLRGMGPFDVTMQPTLFKVDAGSDRSQSTTQLRTEATILYRILDEEAEPGIRATSFAGLHPAYLHLVATLRHDAVQDGLTAFENDRVGLGLQSQLFVRGFADLAARGPLRFRGASLFVAADVARERFPRLGKEVNLVDLSITAGY